MWQKIIIILIVLFLGYGLYGLIIQNSELSSELEELTMRLNSLESENSDLKRDIDHYQHPENLIKIFKQHFNYRQRGEELIIIVPDN